MKIIGYKFYHFVKPQNISNNFKYMTKPKNKRQIIFDVYSNQLKSLTQLGLCNINLKFQNTYICPICFEQFSEVDLDTSSENFLTLEDAPPKSLGGKANTLTCRKCNNKFGHTIDFHLLETLNEFNVHSFLPNTGSKVFLTHKGTKVQGILKVDENGEITVKHLKKTNNPENLNKYIGKTRKDDIPDLEFPASRVEFKKFEIALLKSAYILAFEKYGYCLILSKTFDIVRNQLKNPSEDIYPTGFWTRQSVFNKSNSGVHLITTPEFEGFQAIFTLQTKAEVSGYGVYLPTSEKTIIQVVEKLKDIEPGFIMKYESYNHVNYFNDNNNQKLCVNFMKSRE